MPDETANGHTVAKTQVRSRLETIFLIGLIIFTLLASLGFVLVSQIGGYGFPSTIVAVLLSICIATLAYTFLGGVEGAVFSIGTLKLAGAVAVIIGTFWVVEGPMDRTMNTAEKVRKGENAAKLIRQESDRADRAEDALRTAKNAITTLKDAADTRQSTSVAAAIKGVEDSLPTDDLGRGVLQLERARKGPWRRDLKSLQLSARFNGAVEKGTFRFCHGKHPDLADQQVEFELVDASAGSSTTVQLRGGADIGVGLCKVTGFDVQLGCDGVDGLIRNLAPTCDAIRGVGWTDPISSKQNFDMTATILNNEAPH